MSGQSGQNGQSAGYGGYDYGGSGFMLVVTAPAQAPGTVQVTALNYSGTSNALPYTYTTPTPPGPPTVSSINPTTGPVSGNTPFVITGTGLDSTTTVTFNGVPATVLGTTGTQVFGLTPAGPAGGGTVTVAVTTAAGPASPGLSFTYYPTPLPPASLTISPATSVSGGGGMFTIGGANLGSVVAVQFNGTFATLSSVTPTSVTGTIPAGTVGPATVTLVTPYGTTALPAGSFAYTP